MDQINLTDDISALYGVGKYYKDRLKKLNIFTIKDFLWHFPFRYDDFSGIKTISELEENVLSTVVGTIKNIKSYKTYRRRMLLTNAKLYDDSGSVEVVWFNQPFISKQLKEGMLVSVSGKPKIKGKSFIFQSPAFEIISKQEEADFSNLKHTARLIPVYPETSNVSSKMIRTYIKKLLDAFLNKFIEYLPKETIKRNNLLELETAINKIHFPDSIEESEKARKRFVFEEMLLTQLHLINIKNQLSKNKAPKIKADILLTKKFLATLPFVLTKSQRQAIWEIMQDLEKGTPMNRLLEGDVGSGKTIVALAVSLITLNQKFQVAFMAPTEVLAKQHFESIKKYLEPFNIKIALMTGEGVKIKDGFIEGKVSKEYLLKSIKTGTSWLVVGTHALIQKNINFKNLGLVIIDEQHRFGIKQRKELLRNPNNPKTSNLPEEDEDENGCSGNLGDGHLPHFLSMTATPIPRTLALSIYGDLDLSILSEMPKNRKPTITKIVSKSKETVMFDFIKKEIKNGRQAFIICPRIEESNKNEENKKVKNIFSYDQLLNFEVKAVKKEVEKMKKIFPNFKVEMLHGKMKPKEKELIMTKFYKNEINMLVATSVIEVGVDVPNATIMLIMGTESFGLAQLHQFRGRVGRGHHQSYCFLYNESNSKTTRERLNAMVENIDGFKLAEIDLKLRGPGEMFGKNQSGFPDLAMSAIKDAKMLKSIQTEAKLLFEEDKSFKKYQLFLKRYQEFVEKLHME